MKDILKSSCGSHQTTEEATRKSHKIDENKVVMELTEKIKRMKYYLFDCQNQNQMLRKELMMANKVIDEELDEKKGSSIQSSVKQGKDKEFVGLEEEAMALKEKISALEERIHQLENGENCSEEPKNRKRDKTDRLKKQSVTIKVTREPQRNFDWSAYEICCKIKRKIEYWKNRNKELKTDADMLRLELKRLVELGKENQTVQDSYKATERELRICQNEKLNLRSKLILSKTKNQNLEEEIATLKEDLDRVRSKTNDDDLLLDALTSQQGTFQDLIQRQKAIGEDEYRKFKEELKSTQNKYTTVFNALKETQEFRLQGDSLQKSLRTRIPPIKNILYDQMLADAELDQSEVTPSNISEPTDTENAQNSEPSSVNGGEEHLQQSQFDEEFERYKKESETYRSLLESSLEELDKLTEIIISNNSRLNEWRSQYLHSKRQQIQKNLEIRNLEQAIKKLEEQTSSLKKKRKGCAIQDFVRGKFQETEVKSTNEEFEIKEEILNEEHTYLLELWENVTPITFFVFEMYCIDIDCSKYYFVEFLTDMTNSLVDTPTVTNTEQSENSDIPQT